MGGSKKKMHTSELTELRCRDVVQFVHLFIHSFLPLKILFGKGGKFWRKTDLLKYRFCAYTEGVSIIL